CLVQECGPEVAACIGNADCFGAAACLARCGGEGPCQVRCQQLFESAALDDFNACAVDKCIPTRVDVSFLEPPRSSVLKTFDVSTLEGKCAGLNPMFDSFPCQIHIFQRVAPGQLVDRLSYRVVDPDGAVVTRAEAQRLQQDADDAGVLYAETGRGKLYQREVCYILDASRGIKNVPDFALVYYRGSNGAWVGFGGAVLYTKSRQSPEVLRQRVTSACKRARLDFDTFTIIDNSRAPLPEPPQASVGKRYLRSLLPWVPTWRM
ncbi:Violaxanthin de-epoxidase-domain-containing protein, partial [Pelagophyceae sp. CCMP2097]